MVNVRTVRSHHILTFLFFSIQQANCGEGFAYDCLYIYVSFPYIEFGNIHWLMYRSRLYSQPQRSSNRTPLGDASFGVGRAQRQKRRGEKKTRALAMRGISLACQKGRHRTSFYCALCEVHFTGWLVGRRGKALRGGTNQQTISYEGIKLMGKGEKS